jgi:hypothetical protein
MPKKDQRTWVSGDEKEGAANISWYTCFSNVNAEFWQLRHFHC